jgi:hypothetical protein
MFPLSYSLPCSPVATLALLQREMWFSGGFKIGQNLSYYLVYSRLHLLLRAWVPMLEHGPDITFLRSKPPSVLLLQHTLRLL